MKNQPWQTKSSTPKYKNPWIEVVEDVVIDGRGQEKIFGIVKFHPGSCVLPMDKDGFVYLAKQYRYALGRESVEGAGGALDPGEDPLTCAKRELKEELGIEAEEWTDLGYVCGLTGIIDHKEYLFLAQGFIPPTQVPYSEEEEIELIRIPFAEAVRMAQESEIVHAQTVALILRAGRYLGK